MMRILVERWKRIFLQFLNLCKRSTGIEINQDQPCLQDQPRSTGIEINQDQPGLRSTRIEINQDQPSLQDQPGSTGIEINQDQPRLSKKAKIWRGASLVLLEEKFDYILEALEQEDKKSWKHFLISNNSKS